MIPAWVVSGVLIVAIGERFGTIFVEAIVKKKESRIMFGKSVSIVLTAALVIVCSDLTFTHKAQGLTHFDSSQWDVTVEEVEDIAMYVKTYVRIYYISDLPIDGVLVNFDKVRIVIERPNAFNWAFPTYVVRIGNNAWVRPRSGLPWGSFELRGRYKKGDSFGMKLTFRVNLTPRPNINDFVLRFYDAPPIPLGINLPVVSDIPDQTIHEGDEFTRILLDDYVSDSDNEDSEIVWTYTGNVELSVSISDDRIATITIPDIEWNGSENVTFMAADPDGLSNRHSVTFTVTPVNDPLVVSDIPDQTITVGDAFADIPLDDYVSDPDNEKSEIAWTYTGNVELSVSISDDRIATIAVPGSEWSGNETITFTATDPGGLSGSDSATFTVEAAIALGDVNNDGKIRSNDAILVLRIAVGLMEPDEYQKQATDMDGDGMIRANDAILILRKAAGLATPS